MPMKKFINDPENLTAELLDGYVKAYSNKVALQSEKLVVRAQPKDASKVAIVTLGGSGHEPALSGFVGEGMLDISVVGDILPHPDRRTFRPIPRRRLFKKFRSDVNRFAEGAQCGFHYRLGKSWMRMDGMMDFFVGRLKIFGDTQFCD